MKISYNWLKKYIDLNVEPEELESLLTSCGLEVESFEETENIKGGLRGLVIGEVLEKEKHPDADRLSVTKVNIGKSQPLQIVCGAANVAQGQKVLVALSGARLFPTFGEPFDIKNSKIRGQLSEGMICAEDEVGLGNSHAGIMVLDPGAIPGTPAAEYFKVVRDVIFEIGLTPNRIDAASHAGVARDLAAVINTRSAYEKNFSHRAVRFVMPDVSAFAVDQKSISLDISIEDYSACGRYSSVCLTDVKVSESPDWLKNYLTAVGIKPINNIVDITNFVMLETGQPLHAFDARKVEGKIVVKKLPKETLFTTLDGIERKLNGEELMICNNKEPMCMAGIFGGLHSGITSATTSIILESAWFQPSGIRKAAKFHGLKTESSFRFERGTDPNGTLYALKRAALMIKEVAGGKISSELYDIYPSVVEPQKIEINFDKVRLLSGIAFDNETLIGILQNCDFKISDSDKHQATIEAPTYKTDVTRLADVVEEVLRTYGYHHIPVNDTIAISLSNHEADPKSALQKKISHHLAAIGFFEIVNNSLTSSSLTHQFSTAATPVSVLNPLSNELDILRNDMLLSMLGTIQYNVNRKNHQLKFFEFGKTYHKDQNNYCETNCLSWGITGMLNDDNWQKINRDSSWYYLKSVVQNSLQLIHPEAAQSIKWEQTERNEFSFSGNLIFKNTTIGHVGMVKKNILKHFDLSLPVFFATINLDALLKHSPSTNQKIRLAPRFPEVKRDLSMLLDRSTTFEQLRELALKQDKKHLRKVEIFDVYEGEKIEAGKKSYALSFTLGDEEATLTDKQIDAVMQKLQHAFEQKLGAIIRK